MRQPFFGAKVNRPCELTGTKSAGCQCLKKMECAFAIDPLTRLIRFRLRPSNTDAVRWST